MVPPSKRSAGLQGDLKLEGVVRFHPWLEIVQDEDRILG
jgi:hypothetical protein